MLNNQYSIKLVSVRETENAVHMKRILTDIKNGKPFMCNLETKQGTFRILRLNRLTIDGKYLEYRFAIQKILDIFAAHNEKYSITN